MEFNKIKFEKMSHGHAENVREEKYKTKSALWINLKYWKLEGLENVKTD